MPHATHNKTGSRVGGVRLLALVCGLLAAGPAAAAEVPGLQQCRRDGGTLTHYLLCLDLHARRPAETHVGYHRALDEINAPVLAKLSRRNGSSARRGLLNRMHHAEQRGVRYQPEVSLVDVIERRREEGDGSWGADCDIFSLLNLDVGERHFGRMNRPRLAVVRTRHDHLVTVLQGPAGTVGVLETVTGTVYPRVDALSGSEAPSTARPMSEPAIVSLYLANIGLALAREGRHDDALVHYEAALRLEDGEFVAHMGKALTLLLQTASIEDDADSESDGSRSAALLHTAERAALRAQQIAPNADGPYSVLGKIMLFQGKPVRAEDYLERALAIRPDPVDFYFLGWSHESQDRFSEAIESTQRGRRLLSERSDEFRALRTEMDYLLAHAYAYRANNTGSEKDLRRAMDHLDAVLVEFPGDENALQLHQMIERLDRRMGPVQRDRGLPRGLGRNIFDASRKK